MAAFPETLNEVDATLYLVGKLVKEASVLETILLGLHGTLGGARMRVTSISSLGGACVKILSAGEHSSSLLDYPPDWAERMSKAITGALTANRKRNRFVHDIFVVPPNDAPGFILIDSNNRTDDDGDGPVSSAADVSAAVDAFVDARNEILTELLGAPWDPNTSEKLGQEIKRRQDERKAAQTKS